MHYMTKHMWTTTTFICSYNSLLTSDFGTWLQGLQLPSAIDVEPQGLAGSFKGVKWMSGLCEGQSKFLHSKLGKHFFNDLMALYSGTLFFWNAFPKRLTHSWKHIISKISRFLLIGWLHLQCFWTYF